MTQIENDVLTVLSTLDINGNNVTITGQLDRKLYLAVNKVLERIGGKWNKKAKAHVFDNDPTDQLNNVIECGVLDPKVKTGYFPTPAEIVDRMIELGNIGPLDIILEPSAGHGHITDRICEIVGRCADDICVCEILPENISVLKSKGYEVNRDDFIPFADDLNRCGIKFHKIIMNPPFEHQNDLVHVTAAFNLLAPNGILVAIMSTGVMFRENNLPAGAFKESGTMVNSILIRLEQSKPMLL